MAHRKPAQSNPHKPGLTVIVPAYNEEAVLDDTLSNILEALKSNSIIDYEIIVFDDNSNDHTGEIVDRWAARNNRIIGIHNKPNRGFGGNYTEGVRLATKEYVILVPGDNEMAPQSLIDVFGRIGEADIIVTYTTNPEVRPLARQFISKTYVSIVNTMFGLDLKYFNGICLIRKSDLNLIGVNATDFAYMTKTLVRLIKLGRTFKEVGIVLNVRKHGASSAFKPKNIYGVLRTVGLLFLEVRILDRDKYRY